MSYALYRTATWAVYGLAAPWFAFKRASGEPGWAERLGRAPEIPAGSFWIHAASVGEVAAAAPLVSALASAGERVFVTTVTPTGKDAARGRLAGAEAVSFAPLDFVPCVSRFVAGIAPRALLLVETELWPTLVVETARTGATVGVVNGRLSAGSARSYRLPGSPIREMADSVAFVACQSDDDRRLFEGLGFAESSVTTVGSTKFDVLGEPPSGDARAAVRRSLGLPETAEVVVFGSVRPREEEAVIGAIASVLLARPGAAAVVAPRHLARVGPIEARLRAAGVSPTRRSAIGALGAVPGRAIVLDSTGELLRVYGAAAVAFVGGSLEPYGGHNVLEPASQGVATVFGPHTASCRDSAERLSASGGGFIVRNEGELLARIVALLSDPDAAGAAGRRALAAVNEGRGATDRTIEILRSRGLIGA